MSCFGRAYRSNNHRASSGQLRTRRGQRSAARVIIRISSRALIRGDGISVELAPTIPAKNVQPVPKPDTRRDAFLHFVVAQ
jgi:hypothetical protein